MIQHPIHITTHALCALLNRTPPANMPDTTLCGISKDTRSIQPGELYIALRGERFDGHAFVHDAIAKGAGAVLVDHHCADVPTARQLCVPDTLDALHLWAAATRKQRDYRIIAITGSVGKTSTKEMMRVALSSYNVHATAGNYNNHIGMPLTLLSAPEGTEYLVLEMGMNHAGEIHALSTIAQPDASIITHVGAAHLEFFDNIEGIARAKAEIMDGMPKGASIILPADNDHIALLDDKATQHALTSVMVGQNERAAWHVHSINVSAQQTSATMSHSTKGDVAFTLSAIGQHHAMNAAKVIACLSAMGIAPRQSAQALTAYVEPGGRGKMVDVAWKHGSISIIDETYNASPAAMDAAFARACALALPEKRRVIAVLGDMRELGEDADNYHVALLDKLKTYGIYHIFCIGTHMHALHHAAKNDSAMTSTYCTSLSALTNMLASSIIENDMILCKASRGEKLETVIHALTTATTRAEA